MRVGADRSGGTSMWGSVAPGAGRNKARKHHRGGEGGCFRAYVVDSESGGGINSLSEVQNDVGKRWFLRAANFFCARRIGQSLPVTATAISYAPDSASCCNVERSCRVSPSITRP